MIPSNLRSRVEELAATLSDKSIAQTPEKFPKDLQNTSQSGLYVWWADGEATGLLSQPFGELMSEMIYAGETGATRWPSGRRSNATLYSRIRNCHISGNVKSSTFRETLSAILLSPLGLRLVRPRVLAADANQRVSEWIRKHLQVSVQPYPDRGTLKVVEECLNLNLVLDPPLNLKGMQSTTVRERLKKQGQLKIPELRD